MQKRLSRRAAALAATVALLAAASPALAQEDVADGERQLPTPVEEVPVFRMDAELHEDGSVSLTWPAVEAAVDYGVFVNRDTEEIPEWLPVNGELAEFMEDGEELVRFVDPDPPTPLAGRETVSYAAVAVNEEGEVIAEGRIAVDTVEEEDLALPPAGVSSSVVVAGAIVLAVVAAVVIMLTRRAR